MNLSELKRMLKPWIWEISGSNMLPFAAVNTMPVAATSTLAYATNPRALTVVTFKIALFVVTTNDASNYWTIKLQTKDGAGALTDITNATVNTSAIAADTWTVLTATVGTAVASGVDAITCLATKTLSAGALYWGAPLVWYA